MEELYTEMAAAIKQRNHAIAMLKRWQATIDDAEDKMAKLSGELAQVPVGGNPEGEQFEVLSN